MGNFKSLHDRRKQRNRSALKNKSKGLHRLSVFRSSKHIYGQIIDDEKGLTVTSASTLDTNIKDKYKNCGSKDAAILVGKLIAEKAMDKGISNVVFDRGGYIYHGRVKCLADAAREAGLKF